FEQARRLGLEALRLAQDMGNSLDMAKSLITVAGAVGVLSSLQPAVRWLGAAEGALESMGALEQLNDRPTVETLIAAVRARFPDTTYRALIAEGRLLALDEAVRQALDERDSDRV